MRRSAAVPLAAWIATAAAWGKPPPTDYLTWSEDRCRQIGDFMRRGGRAGSAFSLRGLHSERAFNYKLRATWLTPEVIRATARQAQLESALSDEETAALVEQADEMAHTVFLVEIDPNEGSGVIPLDWVAMLRADTSEPAVTRGAKERSLRRVRALAGTHRRDYSYDRFWVAFPLISDDGEVTIPPEAGNVELVVRIRTQTGTVSFPVPTSVRQKAAALQSERPTEGAF